MRISHNKQQYIFFSIEKGLKGEGRKKGEPEMQGVEGGRPGLYPSVTSPPPRTLWMLMTKIAKSVFNQSINQSTLLKHGKRISKLFFRHAV